MVDNTDKQAELKELADGLSDDVLTQFAQRLMDGNKIQRIESTEGGYIFGLVGGEQVVNYAIPAGLRNAAVADIIGVNLPSKLIGTAQGLNVALDEAEERGIVQEMDPKARAEGIEIASR